MKTVEEKIWDTITDSAKKKFDYTSFKKDFPFDPDMIIFKIIMELASKEKKEILVLKLHNDVLMTGYKWDKVAIAKFIEDKDTLFKTEIFASQLAGDMLNNGGDPIAVLNSISKLL